MSTPDPSTGILPVALTIAGSDSGGGAGIQADLKTFAALGVFGTSAITAITAQNPDEVSAIQAVDPAVVEAQIAAVRAYFPVAAAKTGMLFSKELILAVRKALGAGNGSPLPLVVDPVMVATSGAKLLNDDAIDALCAEILPMATLITPNMDEAALLAGHPVENRDDLETAARTIYAKYRAAVLVKGGHLQDSAEAVDLFWDGTTLQALAMPFLPDINAHGTGCTLSAAIAAHLALGAPLIAAVAAGKRFLHQALRASISSRSGMILNHGFAPRILSSSQR